MRTIPWTAALMAAAGLAATPWAAHGQSALANPGAWRDDLAYLARALPAQHPHPFTKCTRAQWDSAVAALDARLGGLRSNQAYVALQQLVALLGDGHTSLSPWFERVYPLRYYPIELYRFDDGVFVRSAPPALRRLVGGRVVSWGRVSIDEAMARATTTISADNAWWAPSWAAQSLAVPEIVDGLGLADDVERLPVVVRVAGRDVRATLQPAGPMPVREHGPVGRVDRTGWIDMRGVGEPPPWLRQAERPYVAEYLAGDRTLYVTYRGVVDWPDDPNAAFWGRVFSMLDSLPVERLVLDLRENVGGNSFYNTRVIRGIVGHPRIDQPGRLFVVTGSRTFSAAMNLTIELQRYTRATFVGEPTGSSVQFFGDHEPLRLPRTGLAVAVSTLFWQGFDPRDHRQAITPSLYTPLSSVDYAANRDPAWQAIRAAGTGPTTVEQVAAAIERGDTAGAERVLSEARRRPINRFRELEAEVNGLGYRWLNEHRADPALLAFRLNTRVYPESANTWDSLGEAYARSGQREAAITAFRQALVLSPGLATSVEWLRRLTSN